jgi:2-oxoglutarate ferredoxin oxidoreductase subunit beta
VEIYQNCNIFNDGAFEVLKSNDTRDKYLIRLEHGKPLRYGGGPNGGPGAKGIVRASDATLQVVDVDEVGEDALLVHDAHAEDPDLAFAISRLPDASLSRTPIGVFRAVDRPTYDDMLRQQIDKVIEKQGSGDEAALAGLIAGNDTWTIS